RRYPAARRAGTVSAALPGAVVGWHAAADGARAHAHLRSRDPVDGRAVRRARRTVEAFAAELPRTPLGRAAQDRGVRYPRFGGSAGARRPRGGLRRAAGER